MSLSGFLYVAIVVGWAVYLVPFALRRYDEATRHRSIDRFSSAMRVLGRREGAEQEPPQIVAPPAESPKPVLSPAARKAARVAARRRRRVFLTLLLALVATCVAAGLGLAPWWSAAIPGGLVVLWLVLCRTQARREDAARENVPVHVRGADPVLTPRNVGVLQTRQEPSPVACMALPEVEPDDEPTVVLQRADLEAAGAVASAASSGTRHDGEGQGSLWDPVPVTLPTYVHKPRAPRTFRTIDLGAPDVQTSGRTEDAPARTSGPAAAHAEPAQPTEPTRRAVGE